MVDKMKNGELVLLLSKENSYIVEIKNDKFNTQQGIINLAELKKKTFGDEIKTHLNKKFKIAKPSIEEILFRKIKRGPQVILPKDMGLILAFTGVGPGDMVVDAGTGTGFLAIFLAHYVKPGIVTTYEKDKRFIKKIKENLKNSGLDKFIKLKQKDVSKGLNEKNVDLITLDFKGSDKIINKAYNSLKLGGWLVVYSPTVDELMKAVSVLRKSKFANVKTVENIVREWQIERTVRPKTMGLMHSGFLTFARKIAIC